MAKIKISATFRYALTIVVERPLTFDLLFHRDPTHDAYCQAWQLENAGILTDPSTVKVKGARVIEVKRSPGIWDVTELKETNHNE
jgi:hypothetical protein